jgi:group I intron endonuclease
MAVNAESGIYQIQHKVSGKMYIGSSANIRVRLARHRLMLNQQKHPNSHLQNAWNKYGSDGFLFATVAIVDKQHLLLEEQALLDGLKGRLYNQSVVAGSPMRNRKHTAETKANMSAARSGDNNAFYGRQHSEATKQKIAESKKGRVSPNKGKSMSDAAKEKMRLKKIGVPSKKKGQRSLICGRGHAVVGDNAYYRADRQTYSCKACGKLRSVKFNLLKETRNPKLQ